MGQVYLAADQRLQRNVALKVIASGRTDDRRSRILREAQLASALDHPNVCSVYDFGEEAGRCFIAMQHVKGQTLEQLIGGRPLPLQRILSIAIAVADALAAAHKRGIIHRDIKPRNIIVDADGLVKILDFGLARLLAGDNSAAPRGDGVAGTPAYMSPEQVRGEKIDHRSDIFSFGAVLYQMTTGKAPFRGASSLDVMQAVIGDAHIPPRELNPLAPPRLAAVMDRALTKSPEKRYQAIDEMASDLKSMAATDSLAKNPAFLRDRRRRRVAVAAVAALAFVVALGWFAWHTATVRWARQQVPVIEDLAKTGRLPEAYDLTVRVRKYLPGDPKLTRLAVAVGTTLNVKSKPSGARVYLKRFAAGGEDTSQLRAFIGTTPISNLEIARGSYVVSLQKEGFAPFQRTWSSVAGSLEAPDPIPSIRIEAELRNDAKTGMVFVPGGDEIRLVHSTRPTDDKVKLDDYWIDAFEVTNRDYKKFIEAGGYQNASYWPAVIIKAGRKLTLEDALRELVDGTRESGPRGWSHGTYPEGKADHPVTEVTWYEAMAYAKFRNKSLPTIFQWERAARYGACSVPVGIIMPWGFFKGSVDGRANLNSRGTVPVGRFEFGMSPFGCYDMAGNVAEWCLNETASGFIASGGSWASLPQVWGYYGTYPGFNDSDKIGFRCVLNPPKPTSDQGAMWIVVNDKAPEYTPVPETKVRSWIAEHFEYDRELPPEKWVQTDESDEWRCERIEYNGAEGQRAIAYLYLPRHTADPHQVIHLLPAGDVTFGFRTVPQSIEAEYLPFVRTGRAVFAVVLSHYRERDVPRERPDPRSIEYVEWYARHIAEMRRGLDYLLARPDIDASRVAFLGVSFGGGFMVLPAVESRYRAVVISGVGLEKGEVHRKAFSINYIPLIKAPTLLFHGQFDEGEPLRTVAEPVFNLLPDGAEKFIHTGGHHDPKTQAREVNAWLNKTFGPATPGAPK
jgi:formylglycine-generating enzyme required for sulfatase activity